MDKNRLRNALKWVGFGIVHTILFKVASLMMDIPAWMLTDPFQKPLVFVLFLPCMGLIGYTFAVIGEALEEDTESMALSAEDLER